MPDSEKYRSPEPIAKSESASVWAQDTTTKLKILEAASGEGNYREERHWELIRSHLEHFFESQIDSRLSENLEEQASQIYDNRDQAEIGARMRGYFFENLSRHTPLTHPLVVNYQPAELEDADSDDLDAFNKGLEGLTQKTVFELRMERPQGERLAWDKGALIAKLISEQLEQRMSQEQKQEVFIYIPALDKNFATFNQHRDRGDVIVRYNPQARSWVAEGKFEAKNQAAGDLVKMANELNLELSQALTVPDAVVFDGQKPVGTIETKCWQTEELAALVEFLKTQPDGPTPGGLVEIAQINFARFIENKPETSYKNSVGLNLALKLAEEVAFVEASAGEKIANPLVVLRLPGNIPPDEIEELQTQLLRKGFKNVLVQQLLLSTTEVEAIAKGHIQSDGFINLLSTRFKKIQAKPLQLKNIKARALALGVDLNDLVNIVPNTKSGTTEDERLTELIRDYERIKK